MELYGHKNTWQFLSRLADTDRLGHAYLFFGDAQVGKFTFAEHFARTWDVHAFDTLILSPREYGTIGIDQIRGVKKFLWQKPIFAPRRTVILDDLEYSTDEAQNALLKVLEEPPAYGILIGIISDPELLFPTVRSRFQKIYFPRVPQDEMRAYATHILKIPEPRSAPLLALCHGRPGMLAAHIHKESERELYARVQKFTTKKIRRSEIIASLFNTENPETEYRTIQNFFKYLVAFLAADVLKNRHALHAAISCLVNMQRFQTNKKLQLEALARIL